MVPKSHTMVLSILFLLLIGILESSASYDNKMQDLLEEFQNLKDEVVQLKLENGEMRRHLDSIDAHLQTKCPYENILSVVKTKRLLAPPAPGTLNQTVAFSVVLTKDFALGPHQTVAYDKVLTNFGNAYDTKHGHFTAPISGIYLISASSMSISSSHTEIVRNGVPVATMYAINYDIASHTIILELEPNDNIWVRNMETTNAVLHSGPDRFFSSFSGILMLSL